MTAQALNNNRPRFRGLFFYGIGFYNISFYDIGFLSHQLASTIGVNWLPFQMPPRLTTLLSL